MHGITVATLLTHADAALYTIKRGGHGRHARAPASKVTYPLQAGAQGV